MNVLKSQQLLSGMEQQCKRSAGGIAQCEVQLASVAITGQFAIA
jgi:hypothetical protein